MTGSVWLRFSKHPRDSQGDDYSPKNDKENHDPETRFPVHALNGDRIRYGFCERYDAYLCLRSQWTGHSRWPGNDVYHRISGDRDHPGNHDESVTQSRLDFAVVMGKKANGMIVENVTDAVSNPFGMRPPCPHTCNGSDRRAVFGYGDANADFHVVGNHPGVHGGTRTGVPFTDHATGERIIDVLEQTGFVTDRTEPTLENCYLSYIYLCCVQPETDPTDEAYARFEPFFDAELRAIAADVLVPVGRRATMHVLSEYTARRENIGQEMDRLHGEQLRGRGFLVVPFADPAGWDAAAFDQAVDAIEAVLAIDYHQMVDLGRFIPGGDPYFVR